GPRGPVHRALEPGDSAAARASRGRGGDGRDQFTVQAHAARAGTVVQSDFRQTTLPRAPGSVPSGILPSGRDPGRSHSPRPPGDRFAPPPCPGASPRPSGAVDGPGPGPAPLAKPPA